MRWKNSDQTYGIVAQAFHWLIVLLIIVQYLLGKVAHELPPGFDKLVMMSRHKSLGMTILGLALLRIAWRLCNRSPAPPPGSHAALRLAGLITHVVLYALLILLPVTGWLASSAANSPVSWWGVMTFPDLISPSETRFESLGELHELLTVVLVIFAGVHTLAALVHHFIYKDTVLRRKLPGWPGLQAK